MKDDLNNIFISNGVYLHKNMKDSVFVCLPCFEETIGKLIVYIKNSKTIWERTPIVYFLNHYYENDIKEFFLNRENYDMIGIVGNNFEFSKDEECTYLLRK